MEKSIKSSEDPAILSKRGAFRVADFAHLAHPAALAAAKQPAPTYVDVDTPHSPDQDFE